METVIYSLFVFSGFFAERIYIERHSLINATHKFTTEK